MSGQRSREQTSTDRKPTAARIVRVGFVLSLSLSVLLVGTALLGTTGVMRHEKLRNELERVRVLNDNLAHENRRLRAEAKALRSDPEYIEAVIRDELGWVKKNEIVFIFPKEGAAP